MFLFLFVSLKWILKWKYPGAGSVRILSPSVLPLFTIFWNNSSFFPLKLRGGRQLCPRFWNDNFALVLDLPRSNYILSCIVRSPEGRGTKKVLLSIGFRGLSLADVSHMVFTDGGHTQQLCVQLPVHQFEKRICFRASLCMQGTGRGSGAGAVPTPTSSEVSFPTSPPWPVLGDKRALLVISSLADLTPSGAS